MNSMGVLCGKTVVIGCQGYEPLSLFVMAANISIFLNDMGPAVAPGSEILVVF